MYVVALQLSILSSRIYSTDLSEADWDEIEKAWEESVE